MAKTAKPRQLTDAEREQRRAQDRETSIAAVRALQSSAGWQTWLKVRRRFYTYTLLISSRTVADGVVVGVRRSTTCRRQDGSAYSSAAPAGPLASRTAASASSLVLNSSMRTMTSSRSVKML